tara:strand:- start:767 stop:1282 length:516 start_codon:yes stop_codon:yes gene_type:complete
MPTTTPALQKKSNEFMDILQELLGIIDDFSQQMGDGNYLNCMNLMKKLGDHKGDITPVQYIEVLVQRARDNSVVMEHSKRIDMKFRKKRDVKTDEQKHKDPHYCRCNLCDRFIVKDYKKEHQLNDVCRKTKYTKAFSSTTGLKDTSKYAEADLLITKWLIKTGRYSTYFNQ